MIMKNNLSKVVITGGAGFIGSNLIKKLLSQGAENICVIDDLSTGKIENIKSYLDTNKVNLVDKRVEDCDNLDSLLEGVDFCFHLAAGVGVQYIMENVSKALLTNIEGTHKIIESCKNKNVPILITSTSEVYGVSEDSVWTEESKSLIGPPTKLRWSYAASKLIDEFLALSEYNDGNLKPIIVRLFNIIGTKKWYFKAYDSQNNLICELKTSENNKNNYLTYVTFIQKLKKKNYRLRKSDIIEITDNTTSKNFLMPQFLKLATIYNVYEIASISGYTKNDLDTIKYASQEKKNMFILDNGLQYKNFIELTKHL